MLHLWKIRVIRESCYRILDLVHQFDNFLSVLLSRFFDCYFVCRAVLMQFRSNVDMTSSYKTNCRKLLLKSENLSPQYSKSKTTSRVIFTWTSIVPKTYSVLCKQFHSKINYSKTFQFVETGKENQCLGSVVTINFCYILILLVVLKWHDIIARCDKWQQLTPPTNSVSVKF